MGQAPWRGLAAPAVDVPPEREASSSAPSVQPGGRVDPPVPPQAAVPPPPVVDYQAIATIVAQVFQQGMQQWRPPVEAPVAPPPPAVVPPQPQSITKIHYKALKEAKVPTFEGGPDPLKAEKWLDEVEQSLKLFDVPAEVKASVIIPFLTGEAAHWWKTTEGILKLTDQQVPWVTFKEAFLKNYFPQSLRAQKVDEFYKLRQTEGMTVVEFAHRFQALGRHVPSTMQDEVAKMY